MKKQLEQLATKAERKVLKYEPTKENKKRRLALPTKELRRIRIDHFIHRLSHSVLGHLVSVSHKSITFLGRNYMYVAFLIFTLGIFISGFFAAKGMAFESLLSAVIGFTISMILSLRGDN